MIPSEPRAPAREDPSLALGARTEMYDDQGLVMNLLGLLQTRFRRRFDAGINPGAEQNAPVGTGTSAIYPDVVLTAPDRGKKVAAFRIDWNEQAREPVG